MQVLKKLMRNCTALQLVTKGHFLRTSIFGEDSLDIHITVNHVHHSPTKRLLNITNVDIVSICEC